MKYHISVTEEDIKYGVRLDGKRCAVARSIGRTFGKPVECGVIRFRFIGDLLDNWYFFPEEVTDKICQLDWGHKVAPFVFDVEV